MEPELTTPNTETTPTPRKPINDAVIVIHGQPESPADDAGQKLMIEQGDGDVTIEMQEEGAQVAPAPGLHGTVVRRGRSKSSLHSNDSGSESDRDGLYQQCFVQPEVRQPPNPRDVGDNLKAVFDVYASDGMLDLELIPELLDLVNYTDIRQNFKAIVRDFVDADFITQGEWLSLFFSLTTSYTGPGSHGSYESPDEKVLRRVFQAIQNGNMAPQKRAFDRIDANGDRMLSLDELKHALGEELALEAFAKVGCKPGGEIPILEYMRFILGKNQGPLLHNVNSGATKPLWQRDKHEPEEVPETDDDKSVMERMGMALMGQTLDGAESDSVKESVQGIIDVDPESHVLGPEKIRTMKWLERITIFFDMCAGAVSGLIVSFIENEITRLYGTDGMTDESGGRDYSHMGSLTERFVYFWLIVMGISIVLTFLEIIAMYLMHLRAASKASQITGIKNANTRKFIISALSRAALEIPQPKQTALGVNPLAQCSKTQVMIAGIVYKLKRSVTTFLLRILVKRVLARVAVKTLSYLPFLGVVVNMVWNGFIGYKAMRATRIISFGPSMALKAFDVMLAERRGACAQFLTARSKEGILRAIACVVVHKQDMHPNLYVLLAHVCKRLEIRNDLGEDVGSKAMFHEVLRNCMIYDKRFIMQVLAFSCILDGFVQSSVRGLFEDSCKVAKLSCAGDPLAQLVYWFIRSQLVTNDLLAIFEEEDDNPRRRTVGGRSKCRTCCGSCMDRFMLCIAC